MKQTYYFLMILFIFCFTSKLYSQSVPSYVPTNGLVGWWGFNGNAQDGSGNGNHGTVNGATLTTDRLGNLNKAYFFDGIDDFIEILFHSSLNSSNGSISAWIKSNGILTNKEKLEILKNEKIWDNDKDRKILELKSELANSILLTSI